MRLVSYTRTTSCLPGETNVPADIISMQNTHIREYGRKHGWKISEKYSDRKNDSEENTAFERMLSDGMQRKFDAVILEYAYDGFTGTNFNRPAFRQMIEDAKKGLIDTILVKDLSRLGRDYITAGDYIEQIFPLLGVRFIAVNNGYDSSDHSNSAMGFDVAVNNLINTFYSRDLSKKTKQDPAQSGSRGSVHLPQLRMDM